MENIMYLIRRIYKTKPGQARKVASLVHKQATIYRDAGHRPEFRISFNGYTLPGENDTVFLEWVADKIESPMRDGNNIPPEAMTVGAQVRELIESQRIEFMEYLSDDKILKD